MWKTSASAVAAQPQYNNRDDVLKLLAKQYQEAPVAAGVDRRRWSLSEKLRNREGR